MLAVLKFLIHSTLQIMHKMLRIINIFLELYDLWCLSILAICGQISMRFRKQKTGISVLALGWDIEDFCPESEFQLCKLLMTCFLY